MQLVVFTSIRFSSPPPLPTVKSHIKSRYGCAGSAIKSISFTLYIFLLLKHDVWLLQNWKRSGFVFLQIILVHRVKRQDFRVSTVQHTSTQSQLFLHPQILLSFKTLRLVEQIFANEWNNNKKKI